MVVIYLSRPMEKDPSVKGVSLASCLKHPKLSAFGLKGRGMMIPRFFVIIKISYYLIAFSLTNLNASAIISMVESFKPVYLRKRMLSSS